MRFDLQRAAKRMYLETDQAMLAVREQKTGVEAAKKTAQ